MMHPDAPVYYQHDQHLADEAATMHLGHQLAKILHPGLMIWLNGDLGAGKTTLVRGLLRGYDFTGKVKSPTYALVEVYELSNFTVYHYDLYRFKNALEWEDSGFSDDCHANSLCLVEWPEKAMGVLPGADVLITLLPDVDGRSVQLSALTNQGETCLRKLQAS